MRGMIIIVFLLIESLLFARSSTQVENFRRAHPCPATGKTTGRCPGYVINHAIPLCWGGPDDPNNMEWEPADTAKLRDRFEKQACAMKKKVEGKTK